MQKQSLVIQGYQTEESSPKMKLKEGRLTKKIMKRKTPQNCKSPTNKEAEVYDNNKNVTEEKKSSKA